MREFTPQMRLDFIIIKMFQIFRIEYSNPISIVPHTVLRLALN